MALPVGLSQAASETTRCASKLGPVARSSARSGLTSRLCVSGKALVLSVQHSVQEQKRSCFSARALADASETTVADQGSEVKLLDVQIESEVGQTYGVLQQHLAKGEWELADQETRKLICVLAGEGAAKRKWVYFTEAQFIPQKDLLTIDRLWRAYSNDKFGYSVQRRIWKALDRRWKPFFLKIEWTYGENSTYKKFPMEYNWAADAPKGHLPLTNCLRGTQLLENLLLHPAFAGFDDEQVMPDDTKLPDYSKAVPAESGSSNGSAASSQPSAPPKGLTGSIFDEDFNSSDYGF